MLDGKKGKLSTVTPELFFVGADATMKKSFPITHTCKSKQAVPNLAQSSRIQVLAAAQADEKGGYYYLVKSASGLIGWCNAKNHSDNTKGCRSHRRRQRSELTGIQRLAPTTH